jgi:hypothetical protein
MKTWPIFVISQPQRSAGGTILAYPFNADGKTFETLDACRKAIQAIRDGYLECDLKIAPDEFVPVQITTTIHEP